jgi:hypothetical protein
MIPFMALTPGGGRSPSTQPPPSPPANGQPQPTRDKGSPPASSPASFSVLRWGALIGGLVIIADLAAQAMSQRTRSPDDLIAIGAADQFINYILFSILGILVVRETRLIYLGAVAGVFASLLDATVVAAAAFMAPPSGAEVSLEEYFIRNVAEGTLFAGLSGLVYMIVQRWSGGRRPTGRS